MFNLNLFQKFHIQILNLKDLYGCVWVLLQLPKIATSDRSPKLQALATQMPLTEDKAIYSP